MSSTSFLNQQVNGHQILKILGCPTKSNAIPTISACPLCHADMGAMSMFADYSLKGEWVQCSECLFSGDMITLAAAVWKLGIERTIWEFAQRQDIDFETPPPNSVVLYLKNLNRQERIRQLWQQSSQDYNDPQDAEQRMQQRWYHNDNPPPIWSQRVSKFMGCTHKIEVDRCLTPSRVNDHRLHVNDKCGSYSSFYFKGKAWKHVLLVPFYDLPDRICSLLCIGRKNHADTDHLLIGTLHRESTETGIGMLPALLANKPHPTLGNTKFIFTEPDTAIRFQVRNARESSIALPLGTIMDTQKFSTNNPWHWFPASDLVFWGVNRLTAIKHAKLAKGKVSLLKVSQVEETEYRFRQFSPVNWLLRMRKVAVPWEAALRNYLTELDDMAIENTFMLIDLTGKKLTSFIAGCEPELRQRLSFIEQQVSINNMTVFDGKRVVQRADGWYLHKSGERISNMVIRIDNSLTTRDARAYYQGIIRFQNQEYEFTEKSSILDNGLFEWAKRYLRDTKRVGVPEFSPSWNKRSCALANAFHEIQPLSAVDMMGWDEQSRQFNFPNFSIQVGGNIDESHGCLFDREQLPAVHLQPPDLFPRRHLTTLGEVNDETRIFWATAACIITNVVAPAVNRNQIPILLQGAGAHSIGAATASKLGCKALRLEDKYHTTQIANAMGLHKWPLLITPDSEITSTSWLQEQIAHNCLFLFNDVTTKVLAIRGVYNIVSHPRKLGSMQLCFQAAPYVLGAYLQNLYENSLLLSDEQPGLALEVLHDMVRWFRQLGGNDKAILEAANLIHTPESRPARSWFCELIFKLHHDGVLQINRSDFEAANGNDAAIKIIDGKKPRIWISQNQVSDATCKVGLLPPDILLITKSLDEGGVLLSETCHDGDKGWLIPADWWNQELKLWRTHDRLD